MSRGDAMVGSPCSMRLIINIIEIRMRHDGKQRRDDFLCFYWRAGEGGHGRKTPGR